MTLLRRLSLATTISTITVIGVGALVRATGSGDGCPDWPRCFGQWIPPADSAAIIEYSHRTAGAVAILLLFVTAAVALLRHRTRRDVLIPLLITAPAILGQAALGAVVVFVKGRPDLASVEPWLVTFHIATAMGLLGMLVLATVNAYGPREPRLDGGLLRAGRVALVSVFGLILLGAYVRGEHAGLAFPDFPLMDGQLVPELGGRATAHFLHRVAAVLTGIVVFVFAARARRAADPVVGRFATLGAALFVAQVLVGGTQVWTRLAVAPVVAHVVLAASIWACLVAAVARARLGQTQPAEAEQVAATTTRRAIDRVMAYVALTKPRIIVLLLVTTVPTMVLAARGLPSPWLVLATLIGGSLAAGSANAINMYLDRDIDALMSRTRRRPLPAHAVEPRRALVFAIVLAAVSLIWMVQTVNVVAALLTQGAIAFYVFVYTMGLKRTTPQNIVIGGAAGAVPVLVGWAAVTGTVGWEAAILFTVVFLWTPPHFWALAMKYARDYASAGVPMMPVVAGKVETQRQIVLYTLGTVAVTMLLWPVGDMGAIYLAAACGLGAWFLRYAMVLWRDGTARAASALFRCSISYLALLFAAVGADTLLPLGY